jgi:hypothetical protein
MIVTHGGQLGSLKDDKKLESIMIGNEDGSRMICMTLNDSSLSYFTLDEALTLRDELNNAIKKATGV